MKPVSVIAQAREDYVLEQALLIYRDRTGSSAYVTTHDVAHSGQVASLCVGRPATVASLRQLASAINKTTATSGWVDNRTLYIGPDILVWHRPAARATLFFQGGGTKKKPNLSGTAPQPSLVFAVTTRRWYVWAVKGNERPDANTRICKAPYFNVYAGGEICAGNVELPKRLAPDTAAGFERAFFDSQFTHANQGHLTVNPTLWLWKCLMTAPAQERFSDTELLPTKDTLGCAIKRVINGERYADDE